MQELRSALHWRKRGKIEAGDGQEDIVGKDSQRLTPKFKNQRAKCKRTLARLGKIAIQNPKLTSRKERIHMRWS